jgi:hypothetical protein
MDCKKHDGGPAFPRAIDHIQDMVNGCVVPQDGMTLRDYFAGQALVGIGTFLLATQATRVDYADLGERCLRFGRRNAESEGRMNNDALKFVVETVERLAKETRPDPEMPMFISGTYPAMGTPAATPVPATPPRPKVSDETLRRVAKND